MALTRGRQALDFFPLRALEFSGGLNLRDQQSELAPNESPNLWNVVIDERGGVAERLGYQKWNAAAAANIFTTIYYSRVADKILWYSATDGKLYSDPGTGALTLRRTWTTGSNISIADFAGKVYASHPVDGLYSSSDGVTWTVVTAASGSVPKGDLLAVWQNKIWVAGDPAAKTRLYFSAAGDATKWDATDGAGSNDLREGRDAEAPIVALFGATGADFQANPSLLAFKNTSAHRVIDSSTGAYQTIDAANGAAGKDAVTTAYGRIYTVSTLGCFETDGQSPLIPISSKIDPLFAPGAINWTLQSTFCAGTQGGRVVRFSIARANASNNDLTLVYQPLFKAFTVQSDAMRCYASYPKTDDVLLGSSPSVAGQAYKLNVGGSDDGTAITSWFFSRVFEPLGGIELRVQHVLVRLAGNMNMQVIPNYLSSGKSYPLSGTSGTGFVWGTGVWDTDAWGDGGTPEGYDPVWPRLFAQAVQFRFDQTSSATRSGKQILDGTYQPTVGSWALYGINADSSQLSIV